MKALVLAGGRGKRLDALSEYKNKCMIAIAGRPVIFNSLDYAVNAGAEEIVVVVGYRAEEIINGVGVRYQDQPIRYVIQQEQRGLVHAVACAQEAIDGHDFHLCLGDEVLYRPRHKEMRQVFADSAVFALCGVLDVQNRELIRRTYTIIQGENNQIHRLIEKPRRPINAIMGTGNCLFRNAIYEYIPVTPIHHQRQEKELPDLIQCAVDDGMVVRSFNICDQYGNINTVDDIALIKTFLGEA